MWLIGKRSRRGAMVGAALGLAMTVASCGSSDDETATEAEGADAAEVEPATTAQAASVTTNEEAEVEAAGTTEVDTTEVDTTEVDTTEVDTTEVDTTGELFPDVLGATAEQDDDGTWNVSATLSSPYDSAQRYADAWRIVGADGTVYGTRELAHDHAAEQPFTRDLSSVEIPEDVIEVTIEGRDQVSGWGGESFTLTLER